MATLGQVMVEIGADLKEFEKGMNRAQRQLNNLTHDIVDNADEISKALDLMAQNANQGMSVLEQKMNMIRDRIIQSNDLLMSKATQSEKMIKRFQEANTRIQDRPFLRVAAALEKAAKAGSVLNVAIENVGRQAPLKKLLDEIRFISKGLMNAQAAALAAGIAFSALTYALFQVAKGPKPGDVLQQQAELIQQFTDTLNERTQEIYNFASLFEKVTLKTKVSGKELTKNLQDQVKILAQWTKDLQTLAKRGVDQGLIAELQKMGPGAAAEVHALTQMTDKELNNYVGLWREKNRLARTQAMSELEKLKADTQKKVKELGDSITPLGAALDKFQKTWSEALQPLIDAWGRLVAKLVDGATKIGEFVKQLTAAHPVLAKFIFMVSYLAVGLSAILSPLAIGIGRAKSFRVAFAALWTVIGPTVTGLLSVAGTALLLASALVGLGLVLKRMWQNSETFRKAILNLANGIYQAFIQAFAPVKPALEELKKAFFGLVSAFTGGGNNMKALWQSLGDAFGNVINTVAKVLLPIFQLAFTVAAQVIVGVIKVLVTAFNAIRDWWVQNQGTIMPIVQTIWKLIVTAFSEIGSFIMSIIPPIKTMIVSAFQLIQQVILTLLPVLKQLGPVFQFIWKVIQTVMPLILSIVVSYWEAIKGAIKSAIDLITNIFQFFTNLLQGNWSAAWQNLKNIVSSALSLIWNLIQVWGVGRVLKFFGSLGSRLLGLARSSWNGITGAISGAVSRAWGAISSWASNILSRLSTAWAAVKLAAMHTWEGIKNAIWKPIEWAKNKVLGIIDAIKSAFAKLIIRIPKPKLPHIVVGKGTTTIGGVPISYPTFSIKWYAKGGIIDGASVVGVGEAGAEAILPIENRRRMKPFAHMVADLLFERKSSQTNSGGGDVHIHVAQLVVREEADIVKIAEQLHRLQRIKQRAGGVQFGY